MPNVISVDAAIRENLPYIELRGRMYRLRDLTVYERLERLLRYKEELERAEREQAEAQEKLDAAAGGGEDDPEAARAQVAEATEKVMRANRQAVQAALEDVPDDVVDGLTEREVEVLTAAIAEARSITFPVRRESRETIDPKMIGRATAG